jgi:hypothetical protein
MNKVCMEKHPFRVVVETYNSVEKLAPLLTPDVKFLSPLAITPIIGRDLLLRVLQDVWPTVENTRYLDELRQDNKTVLVWTGEIKGHSLQALDIITDAPDGRVQELVIMMRPFPIIQLLRDQVIERVKSIVPDAVWDINQN